MSSNTSLFTAQLHPGQALGFFVLGASLHDIITRIKAEPQRFTKIDVLYSATEPLKEPVMVNLPANGVRLRFDGPEQRLRLIEVLDFTKNHITFKEANNERDLVRPPAPGATSETATAAAASGPTFKHIYNRFLGPTYDGEFIGGSAGGGAKGGGPPGDKDEGTYVLSYPGVAFTFPMSRATYSPTKDVMSLLSHNGTQTATSMAVFSGDSWAQARETLWTEVLPSIKTFTPLMPAKSAAGGSGSGSHRDNYCADEVSLVRIHGNGHLQLFRKWSTSACTWIVLGQTSPQDLVAELGPPDAIYRKNDHRMNIHRHARTASNSRTRRPDPNDLGGPQPGSVSSRTGGLVDDLTDTDLSSANTASEDDYDDDDDDDGDDEAVEDDLSGVVSGECFYNYFYLGFDVMVSPPVAPSRPPPSVLNKMENGEPLPYPANDPLPSNPDRLTARKVILHGNVPGSYPFNRHRRCRWEIAYVDGGSGAAASISDGGNKRCNSEMPFSETEELLWKEWRPIYGSDEEARREHRGMVINRGWGDSPGSSIEMLGGWEGEGASVSGVGGGSGGPVAGGASSSGVAAGAVGKDGKKVDGNENSTTTLYGFPGLVFEVLRNGFVSSLTVF